MALPENRLRTGMEPAVSKIWTIAGGKGGTGKTFVAASLGQLLVGGGRRVNLIDADLGTPNLHTFLGIRQPRRTLADFIYDKRLAFADVILPTACPDLYLAAGSNAHLSMANLYHLQKQKLLRNIQTVRNGRVIIDTAAGTAYNTLDFFLISDAGILVINPDPASIENVYQFLRSATLRILKSHIQRHGLQALIKSVVECQPQAFRSIQRLIELVDRQDTRCGSLLRDALDRFRPCLIVNKTRSDQEDVLGRSMVDVVRRCLAIDLVFAGSIPYEEGVNETLRAFQPYIATHPHSRTSYALRQVAERILQHEDA